MAELTGRAKAFREAILSFIEGRRAAKEKDKNYDPGKYTLEAWLADAANKVRFINAATHVLKGTHPDTKGSNVYIAPIELSGQDCVGSHDLGESFTADVTGDAGSMPVSKFLYEVVVDGECLFHWMLLRDEDLMAVLSSDRHEAEKLVDSFCSLIDDPPPLSHPLAKQVYWLVGLEPRDNESFHLLQPFYPSSLVQRVFEDIQNARFSEESISARRLFNSKNPCDSDYVEYRGIAVQKLGSSKPQMVSLLNSNRRGVNYLLASLPPKWNSKDRIRVLKVDSVFEGFIWFEDVREQLKRLADFLKVNPEPTKETRDKRKELEQELGLCLAMFGESIRMSREPGWTRESDCRLPLCERLWLDPERTELQVRDTHVEADEAFNAAYLQGDWPDQVAGRFANWMNAQLHKAGLTTVGDIEYRHWARQAIVEADWPVAVERRAKGGVA